MRLLKARSRIGELGKSKFIVLCAILILCMLDFFQHLSSNVELLSCSKPTIWKSSSAQGIQQICYKPERAE